jgi:glycosyltransferase involved in cell wall biosynthesis
MRIAAIINQKIHLGGGFNHTLSVANLLKKNQSADYEFIFVTTDKEVRDEFKKNDIHLRYLRISTVDKFIAALINNNLLFSALKKFDLGSKHGFVKYLNRAKIDLIYFTSPSPLARLTKNHNYLLTVFDLCHRDYLEFPEVRENNNFEKRENFYQACAPKAVKVLTDSEMGRQNLIRRYRLDDDRVATFPFLPSESAGITEDEYSRNYIDIKAKYQISGDYIYYPAQFWPHKNHTYIIDGIKILGDKYNYRLNAVFSGSDKGNLKIVQQYAQRIGVSDQIFYIGFVPGREIPYLYKQSIALVMPTYFGPTNIPPLEAFALKVPVLHSDLPGLRNQVENAALLMDLTHPDSMADQIMKLNHNDDTRQEVIEKGYAVFRSLMQHDHWLTLKTIFDEYRIIMKTWKS